MPTSNAVRHQSLKCSQEVRKIPLERFCLPDDGRKWRQAARSRKAFLLHLSSYANGDGTFVNDEQNYSPSLRTLLKDFSRGSYTRNTEALQKVGLLAWTRAKHYERRVYVIHLPSAAPEPTQESQENQVRDSTENRSEIDEKTGPRFDGQTQNQYPDSQENQYPDSQENQNSIEIRRNKYPDSQKSVSTSVHHPSLPSSPSKEREPNPAEKNSHSLGKPTGNGNINGSGHDKTQGDIAYVQALCFRLMDENGTKEVGYGKSPAEKDVLKFLLRFTRDDIERGLRHYVAGLKKESDFGFVEKRFFADGCGVGVIVHLLWNDWKGRAEEFLDATELDDLAGYTFEEFLEQNPIPFGYEIEGTKLRNLAQKHYERLLVESESKTDGQS